MLFNKYSRPSTLFVIENFNFSGIMYPEYSMLLQRQYDLTFKASEVCYSGSIEGCVVECGIWRGGSTIFLAKIFPDKKIYAFDSFCGFEPPGKSPYAILPATDYNNGKHSSDGYIGKERHVPNRPKLQFWKKNSKEIGIFDWEVSQETVIKNFKDFGLIPEEHGIELIPGFVRETIPTKLTEMGQIAFLRIDVDAYAATYECLKLLWNNVANGGVVVFDDFKVQEANLAITNFFKEINRPIECLPGPENGCYIIK